MSPLKWAFKQLRQQRFPQTVISKLIERLLRGYALVVAGGSPQGTEEDFGVKGSDASGLDKFLWASALWPLIFRMALGPKQFVPL